MSRIISYKGQLPIGEQDRIKLATINGKTGYRIVKFQIIPRQPFFSDTELICQIFDTDQTGNITSTVDFTDGNLLAVAALKTESTSTVGPFGGETIIFDNKKFNQDIFVTATDMGGFTNPVNYYIELESMSLSDIEATMLTLQNIKTITE